MQSSYIPWRGYFDIIDDVDLVIFYDDVQYTRRDWRNRNKIKTPNGPIWITVPVEVKGKYNQTIDKTRISYETNWMKKHTESIRHSYCKAPFFKDYSNGIFDILNSKYETISDLNVHMIHWLMQQLGISTKTIMSSKYSVTGVKTDRLINILKEAGATVYLSGPSAKDYIEINKFSDAGIKLEYKVYSYPEYPQLYGKFIPDVSVLDLLFNCGTDSKKYLKSLKSNEVIPL